MVFDASLRASSVKDVCIAVCRVVVANSVTCCMRNVSLVRETIWTALVRIFQTILCITLISLKGRFVCVTPK